MTEIIFAEDVVAESEVIASIKAKLTDLEAEKQTILEARDAKIKLAREEYAAALKDINVKIVKANRIIRTAETL